MSGGAPAAGRHVVFLLGDQRFAAPIHQVLEILAPPPITPVPGAPEWLLGVFNRRGDIMSAVDLSARLRVGRRGPPPAPRLLVVATPRFTLGVLVDAVEEILTISAEETVDAEANPGGDSHVSRALLRSGRLISILDLEQILESGEFLAFT